jgi:hypothetical protein
MFITRIIQAPRPGTIEMLVRRTAPAVGKKLDGKMFDAVGLVQTEVPNLFYLADVGQKAGDVFATEIIGNCPQHTNTVAFFGDTAAVSAAIQAVKTVYDDNIQAAFHSG